MVGTAPEYTPTHPFHHVNPNHSIVCILYYDILVRHTFLGYKKKIQSRCLGLTYPSFNGASKTFKSNQFIIREFTNYICACNIV